MHRWALISVIACSGAPLPALEPGSGSASTSVSVAGPPNVLAESGRITGVAEVRVGSFIGSHAGCVRRTDGTVACWGGPNLLLQYGRGRTQPTPGPDQVAGVTDAVSLEVGASGHCARVKSGGAVCWNDNGATALPFTDVSEIELSAHHTCVLLGDGTVQCMGQNTNGDLGYEPFGYQGHDWAPVPGATKIAHIVGGAGMCAIRTDGQLLCWGAHPFRPVTKTRDEFIAVAKPTVVAGISGVKRMALAGMPCLVLANDVRCIRDTSGDKPYVLEVAPLGIAVGDIVDLDTGGATVCAVAKSGTVRCWGPPPRPYVMTVEALAKMMRTAYRAAHDIADIRDAVQISMGETHACVTTAGGNARCWGDNEYGELGDGTLDKRTGPSWVSWFHPALMPGPGEGIYGCRPVPDVQRTCKAMGKDCALEPPLDYWSTGPGGGTRCDEPCMARIHAQLAAKAVPPCMCTCSPDYKPSGGDPSVKRPSESLP